jgi:hypothetical protein
MSCKSESLSGQWMQRHWQYAVQSTDINFTETKHITFSTQYKRLQVEGRHLSWFLHRVRLKLPPAFHLPFKVLPEGTEASTLL